MDINSIKKSILYKKIQLSFVITYYSKWDRIFRWVHLIIATAIPILIGFQSDDQDVSTTTIVLSGTVAFLLKLKDYIDYDKIKDNAKSQLVKYNALYEHIVNSLRSVADVNSIRSAADDILYFVTSEYNRISGDDRELSNRERQKFIEYCKVNNIPFVEDKDLYIQELNQGNNNVSVLIDQYKANVSGAQSKEKAKNINVREDLKWTLERMNSV